MFFLRKMQTEHHTKILVSRTYMELFPALLFRHVCPFSKVLKELLQNIIECKWNQNLIKLLTIPIPIWRSQFSRLLCLDYSSSGFSVLYPCLRPCALLSSDSGAALLWEGRCSGEEEADRLFFSLCQAPSPPVSSLLSPSVFTQTGRLPPLQKHLWFPLLL